MDLVFRHDRRAFYSESLTSSAQFEAPFAGHAYPCLLWDYAGHWSPEERSLLARAIIRSNCRYVVCAGKQSEEWHGAIDEVFVREYLDAPEEVRDERHVMTSLHDDDSVEDVAFFFVPNTNFDDHDFADYLVLHIEGASNDWRQVEDSVRHVEFNEAAG